MSFEDITIYRDIPVINNYLALPPNQEADKSTFFCGADCGANAESLQAGSSIVRLGGGNATGGKVGRQRLLRLVGITPNTWYATDPVEDLRTGNAYDGDIDIET